MCLTHHRGWSFRILSSLIAICLSGCGGGTSGPQPPTEATLPVYVLSDEAQHPKRFPLLFADGCAPDEKQRLRYSQLMYGVLSTTPQSETQVDVLVAVQNAGGEPLGEVQWTVVQENGTWKLKSAPLP